ncbi:MAG: hypothetical protein A4E53_03027 [Pelotomaculum sp. PtaB.Bin104]|nr:MAG: hypothetical protein A4E53_03027 [Pelotomaculum sp. PtaB.Bin104]
MQVKIKANSYSWTASIFDTPTGRLIMEALPIKGRACRWGGEIYFSIPVNEPLEPNATDLVSIGALGYWPTGNAFCIFFGPTPVSMGNEIRAASAVNIFGQVEGDLSGLDSVADGEELTIAEA